MIQLKFDWQKIMETRQLYWQKCYEYIISNETVGNYHTDDYKKELLNLMTLERDGGNCGSCGINWKKISFLYNGQECYE